LFERSAAQPARREPLEPGAFVLRAFASDEAPALLDRIHGVAQQAPFRRMTTARGLMSVAMTNCGEAGWLSDRRGYRYDAIDSETQRPWPELPDALAELARWAGGAARFDGFVPNACLINRYEPGRD
jgi:alkylated DNA repair protein (DNA oxidative demethylase)